jgi:hypothetical protein
MPARPIREYPLHPVSLAREIFESGAVAGVVGGVAMALFATTYAAIVGLGFWTPVRAIAGTLLGQTAMTGASGVIIGVAIHVAVSILFGVIFAAITPRDVAPAPALAFGMFAGLAILVMMNLIVLPIINPTVRSHLMWGSSPGSLPVSVAFAMHLIYGLGLSLSPALRRRFSVERQHAY